MSHVIYHGTPEAIAALANRFWQKVSKDGECWLWTGKLNRARYGVMSLRHVSGGWVQVSAHRVSWCLANGRDAGDLCVLHSCDNPSCVRPEHLSLGSLRQNLIDAVQRRRRPNVILTPDDVRAIRILLAGGARVADIARRYGVCDTAISNLKSGRTWSHVTDAP